MAMATMTIFWWINLLFNTLFFFSSAENDLEAVAGYEHDTCTTKLNMCSLKVGGESLSLLSKESKGDKGVRGETGEKGDIGLPGQKGLPGAPGERGPEGFPGSTGDKGNQGPRGDVGPKGDRGKQGNIGSSGLNGDKGELGEKGSTGPQGPPGLAGFAGSCPCLPPTEATKETDNLSNENIGSEDNPAKVVCKYMDFDNIKTEEYTFIKPGLMRVKCQITTDEEDQDVIWTCVPPKRYNVTKREHVVEEKSYWLSSKGVTLLDLYNLSHTQLAWIQGQSTQVKQEIRYHCKNSAPYNSSDADHSLLMLSWNDILFGPIPMDSTPFVYSVPEITNECMKPPFGTARSSIITIKSDSVQRLPVVDFLIRDLRDKFTDIEVEHLDLCFN